jgi:hypothetical protein
MKPIIRSVTSLFAMLLLVFTVKGQREEQVTKLIEDSLRANPQNSNYLFMKAMLLSEKKQTKEAVKFLTLSLKYLHQFKREHPGAMSFPNEKPLDSLDLIHYRAYCYDLLNMADSAATDYKYLQKRNPTDFLYSVAIARLYIKHKFFDKAQAEIDKLKNKDDNNERGMVYQAILFLEKGKYNDALRAANATLKKYPSSIEGLITKGKILLKLNRQAESCNYFSEARSKITPEYFGGRMGYQYDFEKDIAKLLTANCK